MKKEQIQQLFEQFENEAGKCSDHFPDIGKMV